VPTAAPSAAPAIARRPSDAPWTGALDRLVGGADVSVAVGIAEAIVYAHRGTVPRIPASNEKLLTSMAALDRFGPAHRFPTTAASAARLRHGVVRGDLWLVGSGDPELTSARLAALAAALRDAGLREVRGSVIGDTATFDRGWWALGWQRHLSRSFVRRPTALAFDGNQVPEPERAAAASLTASLEAIGVTVTGPPTSGAAPAGLRTIATTRSATLKDVLTRQNHGSVNFDAEMLTKALGLAVSGEGASTADGAAVIRTWAARHGVRADVFDGSGLSHRDRISADGLVSLLLQAAHAPWGSVLERSLPAGGEGTLAGRLVGVGVRAKTGTLFVTPVSALSGYVRSVDGVRVAFSVLSRGMDEPAAVALEDAIVRLLASTPFRGA
jgi:D-alanyl-D-alanine carboxypeptidase/D-alanyl-D-alanine-endopeptidase (penicillin-binding protein 4)